MTTPCLTDYISLENLQTFLDESSQQDGISLRLWFPSYAEKSSDHTGWINKSWSNACLFHSLIRTYPFGREACAKYFIEKSKEIALNKNIDWYKTICPTSLYVFGWPIYDADGNILAILFGGLVRDKNKVNSNEWKDVKLQIKKNHAVIQELENEYCYAPSFSKKQRKHLFSKWQLFCELLSKRLSDSNQIQATDEYWIEWLISFHSCSTIARNLTKLKKVKKYSLELLIVEKPVNLVEKSVNQLHPHQCHRLLITDVVKLDDTKSYTEELPKQLIPVSRNNHIFLSFEKDTIGQNGRGFHWKISKNIISGILINNSNKNVTLRKLLLERQAQVFEEVSKKAVTNLESMIKELFDQLRKVGIINIDFASFSEVIYFPDDSENGKPHFKARVTYPKDRWTKNQCHIIEKLDLYAENPISHGSTVHAFQKSRSVLDRDVKRSTTYVKVQPDVLSSLVIPIRYGPLVLGVIAFDSIEKGYFTSERKLLLENLTQLISPIVYHNKFQETIQNLNRNIQNSAKNLTKNTKKTIRKHILRALCSLVQGDAASYWEQDKQKGTTLYRGTSIGAVDDFICQMEIDDSTLGDLFKGKLDFILVDNLQAKYNKIKNNKSANKHRLKVNIQLTHYHSSPFSRNFPLF